MWPTGGTARRKEGIGSVNSAGGESRLLHTLVNRLGDDKG